MELEVFFPWIAGAIGVPVITYLKGQFGLSGKGAISLTIIASFLLAGVSLFATGDLDLSADFFAVSAQVLGVATAVYKLLPSS